MIKNILKWREESNTYLTHVCRSLAESSYSIHFHQDLSVPAMSVDVIQLGVALFSYICVVY